jgi:uncharacterized protein YjbI with pentapeptide repeats
MGGEICTIAEADTVRQAVEIASLREISLSYANLHGATLCALDAPNVDLCHADLTGCNLSYSNLRDAKLLFADFGGSTLKSANLFGANAIYANFHECDLTGSNLKHMDLTGANLSDADLTSCNLFKADLDSAVFSRATGLHTAEGASLALAKQRIVPKVGKFYGYKAFRNGVVALVVIQKTVNRTNGPNRWCRAESVTVIRIYNGDNAVTLKQGRIYGVTGVIMSDGWDDSATDEGRGISFFLTREEAEAFDWSPEDDNS